MSTNHTTQKLELLPLDRAVFFPRTRGIVDSVRVHSAEAAKVRGLCKQLRLVRTNGESPAAVLLEAIARGLVAVSRVDDPEGRELRLQLEADGYSLQKNGNGGAANARPGAAAPVVKPRPGAAAPGSQHVGRGCPADRD